jgi:23S rRNA pseudouridine2605 synthase
VCTTDRREARPRAVDLITDRQRGRIFTVGRLDEDTEGLLILTNDGEFANRISHPRYGVEKTYWVDVRGRVDAEALEKMQHGVRLAEGWARFEHVHVQKRHEERSILLVTLGEGLNREVRRVLAHLGLPVRTLRRVAIGPLRDRRLKLGHWRPLTRSEVGGLLEATRTARARRGGRIQGFSMRPHPRQRSSGRRPRDGRPERARRDRSQAR